jgi:hypothetical protein
MNLPRRKGDGLRRRRPWGDDRRHRLPLEQFDFGSGTKSRICHQGTKTPRKPFLFLLFLVTPCLGG